MEHAQPTYLRSRTALASVGVLLSTLVPLSGPAHTPDDERLPSVFKGVRMTVNKGDTYRASCDTFTDHGQSSNIEVFLLESPSGKVTGETTWEWARRDGDFAIVAGDMRWHTKLDEGAGAGPGGTGTDGVVKVRENGSVLRAAWAGWHDDVTCRVWVNGKKVTPVSYSPNRASRLWLTDLRGGAALDSPLAGLAVAQSYSRKVTGFLFSITDLAQGVAEVTGPAGETHRGGYFTINQRTNGRWRYSIEHEVDGWTGDHPVFWILELPA